ncbi:MAG: hypothetical protein KA319_07240 [Ferruginibacter sp.]|nr:hypothetical protein [Ferruginibacter sp.]
MKKTAYLLLFCCVITFSSCFEIIEQVFLKADGSGTFQFVLNMSKSKTKLNSISKMKTINGHDVPSKWEVENKLQQIEKAMNKTVGVSAAKSTMDYDNYIVTINCNFAKLSQLNAALKNASKIDGGNVIGIDKTYSYDATTKTFVRQNKFPLKENYKKVSNADKEVFATAGYTSIFKFENTITESSNKDATISPSKKAIMLKQTALDVITEKKSIENKIKLTK